MLVLGMWKHKNLLSLLKWHVYSKQDGVRIWRSRVICEWMNQEEKLDLLAAQPGPRTVERKAWPWTFSNVELGDKQSLGRRGSEAAGATSAPTHPAHLCSSVPMARTSLQGLEMLASPQETPRTVPRKCLWEGALSPHHHTLAESEREDRRKRSPR